VTISPGAAWGQVRPCPDGVVRVADDAGIRSLLESVDPLDREAVIAPRGGDCWRVAGGRPEHDRVEAGGDVALLPWDALEVCADGRSMWAVAHVVARGWAWSGDITAVMNVDHLGSWDVAPKAHPNDGRLDLVTVDATMTWRARWQARRRLPLGTHVPHPSIRVRQGDHLDVDFDRPRRLYVDGVREGSVRHLQVRVVPDRLTLCV
jgi:hypothetical protein